jgi:hypothetical protein
MKGFCIALGMVYNLLPISFMFIEKSSPTLLVAILACQGVGVLWFILGELQKGGE